MLRCSAYLLRTAPAPLAALQTWNSSRTGSNLRSSQLVVAPRAETLKPAAIKRIALDLADSPTPAAAPEIVAPVAGSSAAVGSAPTQQHSQASASEAAPTPAPDRTATDEQPVPTGKVRIKLRKRSTVQPREEVTAAEPAEPEPTTVPQPSSTDVSSDEGSASQPVKRSRVALRVR